MATNKRVRTHSCWIHTSTKRLVQQVRKVLAAIKRWLKKGAVKALLLEALSEAIFLAFVFGVGTFIFGTAKLIEMVAMIGLIELGVRITSIVRKRAFRL